MTTVRTPDLKLAVCGGHVMLEAVGRRVGKIEMVGEVVKIELVPIEPTTEEKPK